MDLVLLRSGGGFESREIKGPRSQSGTFWSSGSPFGRPGERAKVDRSMHHGNLCARPCPGPE